MKHGVCVSFFQQINQNDQLPIAIWLIDCIFIINSYYRIVTKYSIENLNTSTGQLSTFG